MKGCLVWGTEMGYEETVVFNLEWEGEGQKGFIVVSPAVDQC